MKKVISLVIVLLLLAFAISAEIDMVDFVREPSDAVCDFDDECTEFEGLEDVTMACSEAYRCVAVQECETIADCGFCDILEVTCECNIDGICAIVEGEPEVEEEDSNIEEDLDVEEGEDIPEEELEQQLESEAPPFEEGPSLAEQVRSFGQITEDVNTRVELVEGAVTTLTQEQQTMQREISSQLEAIQADIGELQTGTRKQLNTVSTGLAGLQGDLGTTQGELDVVEEQIEEEVSFSKTIKWIFFLLLVITVGLAVYYYTTKKKKNQVNPKIASYITSHVKKGSKLPHIKQDLHKAGWSEDQVEHAYQQTMKQNYATYKKGGKSTGLSSKKKALYISGFTILIIFALVMFLNSSGTGHAIFINYDENESEDGAKRVLCVGEHMPNGEGGCCIDRNDNNICDIREGAELTRPDEDPNECSESTQCSGLKHCVDGRCTNLFEVYDRQGCAVQCNFGTVTVDTNDRETYQVEPDQGGYTAAGGIGWQVLQGQPYCQGEDAGIPIKITEREGGQPRREYVTFLRRGEESDVITHPTTPSVRFRLRVTDFIEECN